MTKASPDWEIYERMIARMIADQAATGLTVTPNARVVGSISGTRRQIDVLIDARHDTDNTRRIIVDAKKRKRKVDVTDVESLLSLMEDVKASHGYLVSPAGHTRAAERRAQKAVSIRIVPIDRLANFDPSTWPACRGGRCKNGRVFWDGYPELSLRIRSARPETNERSGVLRFIHYVGKCDRCALFHVWCITCNSLLCIPEDDQDDAGHQCECRPPWFWLASIEEDSEASKSAELHAVSANGNIFTADRRSL